MDDKTYTITLADGTALSRLRLNGNTFISKEPVDPSIFEGNCASVVINDGETEEVHDDMEYVPCAQPVAGEYWLGLRDIPWEEMRERQLRADVDFIAAMQGVIL